MPSEPGETDDAGVLRNKRDATRYRILVEIAERQPAVSQQEIADEIGVTAQAVSDYLQDLVGDGYVTKQGRGRYEVTKAGVDWLMSRTDSLRRFVEHVSEDVLDEVEIDAAIAATPIDEGDTVSLFMRAGVLHAKPGGSGDATAVAVTDATEGRDIGVTDFEGIIDYDLGTVTVVSIPPVQDGGSSNVDAETVVDLARDHDLVATDGIEGLSAARVGGIEPAIRFGTATAVPEAATRGLDVLLLAVSTEVSAHTDALREHNVGYEVVELVEDQ